MRRLLVLPALAVVAATETWRRGYCWPILNTAWSIIAPRPATGDTEADLIG